jgi:hypothetical protein
LPAIGFPSRLDAIRLPDGSYDSAKLAELQVVERRLAVALFDCDRASDQIARPAMDEVAATWSRDHEVELRTLREKLVGFDRKLAQMATDFGIDQ